LQIALRNGPSHAEAVLLLIDYGANVDNPPSPYKVGTPLLYVAMHGLLGLAELLIRRRTNVNAPAARYGGRTALDGAGEHGRVDMTQLLANNGVWLVGPAFERALERAMKNENHAVVGLLGKRQKFWM